MLFTVHISFCLQVLLYFYSWTSIIFLSLTFLDWLLLLIMIMLKVVIQNHYVKEKKRQVIFNDYLIKSKYGLLFKVTQHKKVEFYSHQLM